MADYYKCSDCGWKGTAEEAMKPDKEIEEDWKKVWKLRKDFVKTFEQIYDCPYVGGMSSVYRNMLDTLVCPKCAGEANRNHNERDRP